MGAGTFRPDLFPSAHKRSELEDEFFSTPFLMSYSGLSKLDYSPAVFYQHYVLKQQEDFGSKYADEGKLIHMLLLKPADLAAEFVISTGKVPSDNPKKVIDKMFAGYKHLVDENPALAAVLCTLKSWEADILAELVNMNLYQSLKTDAQRLEKLYTPDCLEYWDYLVASNGKTVISQDVYESCMLVVDRFRDNTKLMRLMGFESDPLHPCEQFNEIELRAPHHQGAFALRGFLDNVTIDHEHKQIRINDLKKSAKELANFPESIAFWKYWIQAGIYYMLVDHHFRQSMPQHADYEIVFRYVVIDCYLQMDSIRVSPATMAQWLSQTEELLTRAAYHFRERDFSRPYAFISTNEYVL
jgi:hypothetical protein